MTSPNPKAKNHRLNKQKREILNLLAEYFCLRIADIISLRHQAPNDNNRRSTHFTLKLLMKMGLVSRLPYLDLYQESGGLSHVYGLTDRAIVQFSEEAQADLYYVLKPFDEHSQRTLDHELEISFFHIALKRFCEKHGLELYWQQTDLKKTVHPDAYFAITNPAKPEGKNTDHFFLEIERSRMGNVKNGEPSIMRKLSAYYDYYHSTKCHSEWGFTTFRTVLVQRNDTRRQNLLSHLQEKYPHRMFWLTTEDLYKQNIGGEIFKTPKDSEKVAYSFVGV